MRGWALLEPEHLPEDEFSRVTTALYAGNKRQAANFYRTACRVGRTEARAVIEELVRKLFKRHPERFRTNPVATLEWDPLRFTVILLIQLAVLIGIYEIAQPNWDAHVISELVRFWFLGLAINAIRILVSRWGAVRSWLTVFAGAMIFTVTSVVVEEKFTDKLKTVERANELVVMMVGIAAGTLLCQYSIPIVYRLWCRRAMIFDYANRGMTAVSRTIGY